MIIPPDIQEHCAKYALCKGCPLGTCVAPVSDRHFDEWLAGRIEVIRELKRLTGKPLNDAQVLT